VGWYEVGRGPMMSKVAFFVKDVIGPKGCVSIDKDISNVDPSDVSKHTTVDSIIVAGVSLQGDHRERRPDGSRGGRGEQPEDLFCRRGFLPDGPRDPYRLRT
jgi:hypothetical protein